MEWLSDPKIWIGFFTLTALEIVLGIDNVIFISILAAKLRPEQQAKARRTGLLLAMGARIVLLFSLAWMIKLTAPLFGIFGHDFSGRDLILISGGLFLLAKSVHEIHQKLEGVTGEASDRVTPTFSSVIIQILLLDIVFSLDSVITAVGMVDEIAIMIAAVVVAIGVMIAFAETISAFVERHPTIKMLALSFLLLIGTTLLMEGFHVEMPKGYIYFAMGFAIFVEMLNLRLRKHSEPVQFREAFVPENQPESQG